MIIGLALGTIFGIVVGILIQMNSQNKVEAERRKYLHTDTPIYHQLAEKYGFHPVKEDLYD